MNLHELFVAMWLNKMMEDIERIDLELLIQILKDRNVGYFDSLKDGIAYMKQVYIQELYPTHKDLGKEILDSSNTFVEVEEDLDEMKNRKVDFLFCQKA